jgi:methylene-fatty-acyl-phospholipid synthase
MIHSVVVSLFVLSPFPFYWYLWTYPKKWLKMCEGVDPSHRMAQVAHLLKALQILGLVSVATFSVPPIICIALFGIGQFLNYRYMPSISKRAPSFWTFSLLSFSLLS